jgi:hypothetical protein
MSWTWRLESASGAPLSEPAVPVQHSQSDAETWLGETWRQLADAGVAKATLYRDGAPVYDPIPLVE